MADRVQVGRDQPLSTFHGNLPEIDAPHQTVLEIGSGDLKWAVGTKNGTIFAERRVRLLLGDGLQNSGGSLSTAANDRLRSEIEFVRLWDPKTLIVATAALRDAVNGREIVRDLGILLLSQKVETLLGFHSGHQNRGDIILDWGRGSAQVADRDNSLRVSWAFATVLEQSKIVTDFECLVGWVADKLPPSPAWLKGKPAVGIGGRVNMFSMAQLVTRKDKFTLEDVLSVWNGGEIPGYIFGPKEWVQPAMALLIGVMRKFEMLSITYRPTHGFTRGLLTHPPQVITLMESTWVDKGTVRQLEYRVLGGPDVVYVAQGITPTRAASIYGLNVEDIQ